MVKTSRTIIRGVKSVNIVLGDEWNVKIASFRITGDYGDLEYYWEIRSLANKSLIYSFGVLLFEILSGRLATDRIYKAEIGKELASIAQQRFINGTLKELVDPKILEEVHELSYTKKIGPNRKSLDAFSRTAYQCVAKIEANKHQPTMIFVIEELEKALHFQVSQFFGNLSFFIFIFFSETNSINKNGLIFCSFS